MKIRLVDLNTFIIKPDEKAIEKVSEGFEFYLFKSDALLTRSDQLFEAKNGDCILFSANENINIKPTDSELEVLHLSFKSQTSQNFFHHLTTKLILCKPLSRLILLIILQIRLLKKIH